MSEPEPESQNFGHKNGLWVHIKLRCYTFSDSGSGLAFRTDYMDPTQEEGEGGGGGGCAFQTFPLKWQSQNAVKKS